MQSYTVKTKYSTLVGPLSMRNKYPNGTPALQIGGPRGEVLSINLQDYGLIPPDENHVFVKNYGQHEGLPQALADAGIVEVLDEVPIGYGKGNLCRVIAEVIR